MANIDLHRSIDAIWRIESPKLIARLTRMVRDVGVAEELAQDALVAALQQWPESGVPDNPGAWLMVTAKRRAVDLLRRTATLERKYEEVARGLESEQMAMSSDLEASATTCCVSCSSPAIRCSPPRRVSPSRFGCWAA